MPTWPASLPPPTVDGFSEQRQRNVAAFQPDVGPPRYRRRSTAAAVTATITLVLDKDALADFDEFFETDLADGTLPFDMNHPRTGEAFSWVFAEAPQQDRLTVKATRVTCKLQRLP